MIYATLIIDSGNLLDAVNTATKFMTPPKWPSDNSICNALYLRFIDNKLRVQSLNGHVLYSRDIPVGFKGGAETADQWADAMLVPWAGVQLLLALLKAKGKHALVELTRTDAALTLTGTAIEGASPQYGTDYGDSWKRLCDTVLGNPHYIEGHIPVDGACLCDKAGAKTLCEIFRACAGDTGVMVKKALGEPFGDKKQYRNAHYEFSGNDTRIIWMAMRGDPDSIERAELEEALWED